MNIQTPINGTNFFASGLRQKVDRMMDVLWAGGVNNPMDSIEQISYLLFLRLLSEKDETLAALDKKYKPLFSGEWARFAWGNFVTLTGDQLFNAVRDAIEKLHELPDLSSTGKLLFSRATLKIYDRPTLRAIVQEIHKLDLNAHDGHDVKGDMYEYLLSKLAVSGTNGQFRTPRHIIDLIVALVDPKPGQRICDPACGTAGFLVSACSHILRQNTKPADLKRNNVDGSLLKPPQWKFLEEHSFTGYDNDANMVKIVNRLAMVTPDRRAKRTPGGASFCSVQRWHPSVPAHASDEPSRGAAVKNGRFSGGRPQGLFLRAVSTAA